ncbi:MAG: hypothetical protein WBE74_06280 [Terracidiphilus sp.]
MFGRLQNLFRKKMEATESTPKATNSGVPNYPWYGVVDGDELEQGDIFESCPTFFPPNTLANDQRPTVRWEERDLILLSQSCDLVKGRKDITQVTLCEVWRKSEFRTGFLAKTENWEEVRKGRIPRYHLLAPSTILGFEREHRIIDLQQVHSFPIEFLRTRAQSEKRLRLLPPYREHLSQSFARVFMRVGLPIDIPPFKTRTQA